GLSVTTIRTCGAIHPSRSTQFEIQVSLTEESDVTRFRSVIETAFLNDLAPNGIESFRTLKAEEVKAAAPEVDAAQGALAFQLNLAYPAPTPDVESALRAAGFDKVSVKPTTAEPAKTFDVVGTNSVVKQPEANDVRRAIVQALGRKKSLTGANLALSDPWPKSDYVGPKVVKDLKAKAVLALVLSLAAIMVYVKFRFKE